MSVLIKSSRRKTISCLEFEKNAIFIKTNTNTKYTYFMLSDFVYQFRKYLGRDFANILKTNTKLKIM